LQAKKICQNPSKIGRKHRGKKSTRNPDYAFYIYLSKIAQNRLKIAKSPQNRSNFAKIWSKSPQNCIFHRYFCCFFCYFCVNQPIPIIFFINRQITLKRSKTARKRSIFLKNTQNRSIFPKIVSKRVFFRYFCCYFLFFPPETPPGALPDYGRIHDAALRWIAALRAAGLEPVFVADGAGCEEGACGLRSGSGWVGVGPIDSWDQCGSNGTDNVVAVAVLAELWRFERTQEKYGEKNLVAGYHATYKVRAG
jgi:hypothetical protein